MARNSRHHLGTQILSYNVAAEWKRQTRLLKPPLTEVHDQGKSGLPVGELTFVNEQSEVRRTALHRVLDVIKVHDDCFELRHCEPEREVCGVEEIRNSDSLTGRLRVLAVSQRVQSGTLL